LLHETLSGGTGLIACADNSYCGPSAYVRQEPFTGNTVEPGAATQNGNVLISVVVSALCADSFEPQAQRHSKLKYYPQNFQLALAGGLGLISPPEFYCSGGL
jgi:hypothetical protein